MLFITGFRKQADFGHNNQGLEFQMAGADNPAYPGNEAMSATGIATFLEQKAKLPESDKKKMHPAKAAQIIFGKTAGEHIYDGARMEAAAATGDANKFTFTSAVDPSKPEPEYKSKALKKKMTKESHMFTEGFSKLAGIGSSLYKGLKASGAETVGSSLGLGGLKHISEAVKRAKGIGNAMKDPIHRELLAEAVGKAAPSLGAAAGYGVAGKKLYDKFKAPSTTDEYGYYQ